MNTNEEDVPVKKGESLLPPEPRKPFDSECCGTGCTPCVFDIYTKQLEQWKAQCLRIRQNGCQMELTNPSNQALNFICPEQFQAVQIVSIVEEAERVKVFQFEFPTHQQLPVQVGQHVLIQHCDVVRQYTVLRIDAEKRLFDILIKIYPQNETTLPCLDKMLTPNLESLQPSDTLEMRGPFGHPFPYTPNRLEWLILIAAGSGIAPMYRIIEQVLDNGEDETRVKLLFSTATQSQVPLLQNFKGWSEHWNFDVVHFIPEEEDTTSRKEPSYYGMKVVKARLDRNNLASQIAKCDLDKTAFVVCGTRSFEKSVINYLTEIDKRCKITTF